MNVEIIAIGSELTCGARLDTNSQWLSSEMEGRGWRVMRHSTVADDRASMVQLFQDSLQRARIVLVTGGLGPTLDDITRETLAEAVGQNLVEDRASLDHIEALFQSRGRDMPERNRVQALRPEFGQSIHNAHGTAPGIQLSTTDPDCLVFVMPGVPAEMKRMFHDKVVEQLPVQETCVQRTMIRTFGYGESDAERLLGDLTARDRNPEVGITASQAVISLSVTARATSAEECCVMTEATCDLIRQRLGDSVFTQGDAELHHVVAKQIAERNLKVALLESSTTGGLLAGWLTESETSAECLSECRFLPTARSLADQHDTRKAFEAAGRKLITQRTADCVLLSGPSTFENVNGVAQKNGFVGMITSTESEFHDVSMAGNLSIFRQRAARHAINMLRLKLLKEG